MKHVFILILSVTLLAGCARSPYLVKNNIGSMPGIYHEVRSGQTIWGISRLYDIELKEIIKRNRLPNASKIEVGQLIFIPEARERIDKKIYSKGTKIEGFIWPVKGIVVSYFGSTKNMVKNKGIDIRVDEGIEVVASRSGRVTLASNRLKGYGKTIIIDHLDGFQTVYAHNAQNLVRVDQRVKQKQVIARAGKSGRADKGTLHFEIRKKHRPQNPFYYLP